MGGYMSVLSRIRGWDTLPAVFRQVLVLGIVLVVLLIYDQQASWRQREDYYFGFLVPVFVYLVLEERWSASLGLFRRQGEEGDAGPERHYVMDRSWVNWLIALVVAAGAVSLLIGGGVRAAEGGASAPASLALNVGFIL